jgi:hypothetical protein
MVLTPRARRDAAASACQQTPRHLRQWSAKRRLPWTPGEGLRRLGHHDRDIHERHVDREAGRGGRFRSGVDGVRDLGERHAWVGHVSAGSRPGAPEEVHELRARGRASRHNTPGRSYPNSPSALGASGVIARNSSRPRTNSSRRSPRRSSPERKSGHVPRSGAGSANRIATDNTNLHQLAPQPHYV